MARRAAAWIGGIFMAIGLGIAVMTRLAPAVGSAPGFVLDAAAGAFFFAGLAVLARGYGMSMAAQASSLVMLYLFSVPGLWLFLGDEVGQCTLTSVLSGAGTTGTVDPLLCRIFQGSGALLVLLVAVAFTVALAARLIRRPG